MRLSAPRLLAGTTAASLLLAGVVTAISAPGPAQAAGEGRPSTIALTDPVGDMRQIDVRDHSSEVAVPARSNGDIVSEVITYGVDEIAVVTVFQELRRPTERTPKLLYGQFVDYRDVFAVVAVRADTLNPRGTSRIDGRQACVSHRIDYRQNRIVLRLPTECLESPEWIRFGTFAAVRRTTQAGRLVEVDVAPGPLPRDVNWTEGVYRP